VYVCVSVFDHCLFISLLVLLLLLLLLLLFSSSESENSFIALNKECAFVKLVHNIEHLNIKNRNIQKIYIKNKLLVYYWGILDFIYLTYVPDFIPSQSGGLIMSRLSVS